MVGVGGPEEVSWVREWGDEMEVPRVSGDTVMIQSGGRGQVKNKNREKRRPRDGEAGLGTERLYLDLEMTKN